MIWPSSVLKLLHIEGSIGGLCKINAERGSKVCRLSNNMSCTYESHIHDSQVPDNIVSKSSASRGDHSEAPASIERFV